MNSIPKWRRFELLVKSIQEKLTPEAKVVHNEKVLGKSGITRQIDVAIHFVLGQFNVFIAIDCKDYTKPIDIKHIEEFSGMLEDIQATKGAMVTYVGFTKAAKTRAEQLDIDIFTLLDTESQDWSITLSMPIIKQCKYLRHYKIRFSSNQDLSSHIVNTDPRFIKVYDKGYNYIGQLRTCLKTKWNNGELNSEPGEHSFNLSNVYILDNNIYYPINIVFVYNVEMELFVTSVKIENLKGFMDEKSEGVITNEFETDKIYTDINHGSWRKIKSENELSVKPIIRIDEFYELE